MPQIETWSRLPVGIRDHLIERMRDRSVNLEHLNQLRIWIESKPNVPEGRWYKDFGSFKLCGEGKYPKTFLAAGQTATGRCLPGGKEGLRVLAFAAQLERAEIFVPTSFRHVRLRFDPDAKLVQVFEVDAAITHSLDQVITNANGQP